MTNTIQPALDLLASKPDHAATIEELAAACGFNTEAVSPRSHAATTQLRAALQLSPFVSIDPGNGTREDRYSLRPVGPAERRADPTATTLRAMILAAASAYADALADYWISRRTSGDEARANEGCWRASSEGIALSTAFARYVSTGKSPVEYLRDYPTNDVDTKAMHEALAAALEAKLSHQPPPWTPPDHEQD